jgi:hypothetical protein
VTGRPYAIQERWSDLFEETGPWEFAQIDEFSEDQQRAFLGEERFEALQLLEADVMAVPRALERLFQMTPAALAGLRTASDVYWTS